MDEDEFAWSELSVAEEEYEEDEFHFQPVEGDKLELYNERRVWQAEMSVNNRAVQKATVQSQEKLMEQKLTGKPVTLASKMTA